MQYSFKKVEKRDIDISTIYIGKKDDDFSNLSFTTTELEYLKNQLKEDKKAIDINSYFKWSYVRIIPEEEELYIIREKMRKQASQLVSSLKENQHRELIFVDISDNPGLVLAFLEGLALSLYQFNKYLTKEESNLKLEEIQVLSAGISIEELQDLEYTIDAVYHARNLVNEPLNNLSAVDLGEAFRDMGKESGFSVEVFNKKKIASLKLNGLLAVNNGSIDPPTFTVMEWKPDNAVNQNPLVLVGKGVVYDTGGMSLKPSLAMSDMKSDMAGAATVGGIMYALASMKLPYYVIGLVPATDNRVDGNAYVPGDVIKMHNGKTVEVINTDAEGRMILADALSFAQQYNPELVFDFATLTGSASIAIGPMGVVALGNIDEEIFEKVENSGKNTYERIVRLPLWEEYGDMIKSDVADMKNVGGREAGAITAAIFLENFVDYPWLHLDIAPYAYLEKSDSYRGKGATGVGVRLMLDFFRHCGNEIWQKTERKKK
ncbi:MAG: leucyl aminopeptidase family protein [Bacteroidales bacterium]